MSPCPCLCPLPCFLPSSVPRLRRARLQRSGALGSLSLRCRQRDATSGPCVLELGGCTAVALRAPGEAQAQQLPGTIHRRGDSSCKHTARAWEQRGVERAPGGRTEPHSAPSNLALRPRREPQGLLAPWLWERATATAGKGPEHAGSVRAVG